jgi:hypothetical protein
LWAEMRPGSVPFPGRPTSGRRTVGKKDDIKIRYVKS